MTRVHPWHTPPGRQRFRRSEIPTCHPDRHGTHNKSDILLFSSTFADPGYGEGLPMPREPALLTSAGRMPERSQHRVSEGQRAPIRLGGLVDVANVRRRGMGSPVVRLLPIPASLHPGFP
jgi:hypothetical protein